ncbi:creatininase family protein [Microbacterium sp. cx-55]|uniref:creatininase family protein n=1 Tax=unclassified Microbacterium TaxID=2609290 RepID=UPI001CBFDFAC|nr:MULTISPECIES: creatininase family protein [unclassified Microbacterium]MBZ4487468.1 creatininase family protein [Microbacterium sp. cx-55]MCC4908401.1 creatininase family protein [Microbacterium sp. cx-59]UGB35488.1 creatininase family protein [Microbacterium sp. cx-55]
MIELAHASWTDVAEFLGTGSRVAVLPFGALEQHGPHLPLSTDTIQADAVARRLAERLDAALLPAIPLGNTWSNDALPGTVSLSADTVTAICADVAAAVERAGFAMLVVVNGDFGNRVPLQRAAESFAARDAMPVIVLDYPGLVEIGDAVKESPWAAPGLCHADELETSMVLAAAPALVQRERMAPEYPELPADFGLRQMALAPLSRTGVFGDPRPATAEKGERIFAHVVDESERIVRRVQAALERA